MWIKDPKTKEKSATLTFFGVGFGVALVKLLLSGISFGSFSFGTFPGSEFAIVVGAVGGLYTARKYTDAGDKSKRGD